jgi:hypothetical protein
MLVKVQEAGEKNIALNHKVNQITQKIIFLLIEKRCDRDAIDLATICRFQFTSGCVSKHFTGQVTYNEWLAGLEHLFEFNNVLFLKGLPPVS